MIEIGTPRYHDRILSIAVYKIPQGIDFPVRILEGAFAGTYLVRSKVVNQSNIGYIKSRDGQKVAMREIPLDRLERIEEVPKKKYRKFI